MKYTKDQRQTCGDGKRPHQPHTQVGAQAPRDQQRADHTHGIDDIRAISVRRDGPLPFYGSEHTLASLAITDFYIMAVSAGWFSDPRFIN